MSTFATSSAQSECPPWSPACPQCATRPPTSPPVSLERGASRCPAPTALSTYRWIRCSRRSSGSSPRSAIEEPETVLATVLFTDIVGSTEKLAELGDAGWRELVERHHALVRQQLGRFRGRELDTAGDGFFADLRRPDPRHPLRHSDRDERTQSRPRGPRRAAHGRVRASRRKARGARGQYRGAYRRPGSTRRGARVEHGQGSRGRIRHRL